MKTYFNTILFTLAVVLAMSAKTMADEWTVGASGQDFTTIQAAVDASTAGDTIIVVDADHYEGEDWFDEITVDKNLTIVGSGASSTTVHERFVISSGAEVEIQDMTISNDDGVYVSDGGGINNSGTLTLTNCAVSGNWINVAGSGSHGGGICSWGTLTLVNCTVSGNYGADGAVLGGGIYNHGTATLTGCTVNGNSGFSGGGICNDSGTMTLTNCTVSGNDAGCGAGGGIRNNGTLILTNCTVSGNSAISGPFGRGGGIDAGGSVTLENTIVANNTASPFGGPDPSLTGGPDIRGSVTANYCLIEDTADATISGSNNITGQDPLLDTLALNDNPNGTYTHALLEGSPAIDAGTSEGAPDTDQRGVSRPQGTSYDIGAYEAEQASGENTAPVIDGIYPPTDPKPVSTLIEVGADFTDPDAGDTHTAVWSWGDGGTSEGVVDGDNQTVYGDNTYSAAGVYTLTLTVTDGAGEGESVTAEYQYVVIYDPSGGFVTGGGWIDSPANADYQYMQVGGKASFGFVSKYKKGATVPTGNTEFQFKAGDLNFHSTNYDWLVVNQNDSNAQFKGSGTINGSGDYKFMLWAGDGAPDTFRIRIWSEDEAGVETVVYDNGTDQPISGGNIVVHAK